MFFRKPLLTLAFAFAFAAPMLWFSQGAHGWPTIPSSWTFGSDKVVGTCPDLSGTVAVGLGVDGRSAEVSMSGDCNFVVPKNANPISCNINITYTLPSAPEFQNIGGNYQQDWTTACNLPGLIVEGLLSCDDGQGFSFKDALGLAGKNGAVIDNDLCEEAFGASDASIFSAVITFAEPNNSSPVVDLGPATLWNCCHADVVDTRTGTGGEATCKKGNDIQVCFGSGSNTTRAYCSYTDPYNASCGGPNSGRITARLHADVPPNPADPQATSISLDNVALGQFKLNGETPTDFCSRKILSTGEDVIECKFERCNAEGEFIAPDGAAKLTALRNSGTKIECVNQLNLIHE